MSIYYDNRDTYERSGHKFFIHFDSYPENDFEFEAMPRFQITECLPYVMNDDDYAWAKGSEDYYDTVLFIRNGKIIERMTIPDYLPDDYETTTEYVDEIIDRVAVKLLQLNRNVKPIIDHT